MTQHNEKVHLAEYLPIEYGAILVKRSNSITDENFKIGNKEILIRLIEVHIILREKSFKFFKINYSKISQYE